MSLEPLQKLPLPDVEPRKPRIMLMGEFSAGKSTLANLLMGQGVSPVKVTATQLPPVWYAYGVPSAVRIHADGTETPMAPGDLDQVTPGDTRAVKVYLQTEVLEVCDLIDMPGTSDPNMAQEVWEDMVSQADGVVWCTPSNQAWRQSEAALWGQMPDSLFSRSLLLITRIDKLLTERDQARVAARVRREVDGLFRAVFPISLTRALAAGDDDDSLRASGAADFVESLIELVDDLSDEVAHEPAEPRPVEAAPAKPAPAVAAVPDAPPADDEGALAIGAQWDLSEDEGTDQTMPDRAEQVDNLLAADDSDDSDDDENDYAYDTSAAVLPRRVRRDQSRRVRTRPRTARPMT